MTSRNDAVKRSELTDQDTDVWLVTTASGLIYRFSLHASVVERVGANRAGALRRRTRGSPSGASSSFVWNVPADGGIGIGAAATWTARSVAMVIRRDTSRAKAPMLTPLTDARNTPAIGVAALRNYSDNAIRTGTTWAR